MLFSLLTKQSITTSTHPCFFPALEVTTDAPQPPALHIVSPTPRAFTFPITHNLTDSPFASPSNSPFEPDLYPLSLQSTSTPPPFPYTRTFSPDSPLRSSSPFTPDHKRRKSSCSSDLVERRPKKGDEDYVKRPENAFILFRRKCCEDRQQAEDVAAVDGPTKKQRQADLSKTISQQWKSLSAEERQFWEQMAKDKKKEHEQLYPNYVYRPQRAKDKDGKTKNKKNKKFEEDTGSVSFVVPVYRHGRSASAPTPPPYQSIQIPNVYHVTPSCPTSPSLLPMISRRSAHPGHPEDVMSSFDYLPNSYVQPSFPPGQFEANVQVPFVIVDDMKIHISNRFISQSSDFLRNMFSTPSQRSSQFPQLHQLALPEHNAVLLAANQMVSPSSSMDSNSSGPSSPTCGPYAPESALLSENYMPSDPCGVDAQARAEIDLQLEMQMQQAFAAYSWGNGGSLWGSDSVLLRDDFDLNSIPPIELGVPKYTENLTLAAPNTSGLEFGHEFSHALEGQQYLDDSQNLGGLLGFDEMMAGQGF